MKRFRSWWQKIKLHPYATGYVVLNVVFLAFILFILSAYRFGWNWTGFTGGENKVTTTMITPGTTTTTPGATVATEQQPAKTLWDWLGLLAVLTIPAVVGLGAAWFTFQQGKESNRENTDNQREKALQDYIDKISELLLKEHLGERTADGKLNPEGERVQKIARVRTITVLTQLDARRIGYVFAFLREAGLMSTTSDSNVLSLKDADLRTVQWGQANLQQANLRGATLSEANLREAILVAANLSVATLVAANLRGAYLIKANLREANLREANLSRAHLCTTVALRW